MGIQVMVIETFQNPVLKSAKIRRCQKKLLARFLQKIKTPFLEHAYFPLLKLKMWFFVQECAAELPFLSSVKRIFPKFRFFSQILSPIRLGAIHCAHAIRCAPTVAKLFSVPHQQRALQKNTIYVFLFQELHVLSPNFHIHVSVSDLYIPRTVPHISCCRICRPILEIYKSLTAI